MALKVASLAYIVVHLYTTFHEILKSIRQSICFSGYCSTTLNSRGALTSHAAFNISEPGCTSLHTHSNTPPFFPAHSPVVDHLAGHLSRTSGVPELMLVRHTGSRSETRIRGFCGTGRDARTRRSSMDPSCVFLTMMVIVCVFLSSVGKMGALSELAIRRSISVVIAGSTPREH